MEIKKKREEKILREANISLVLDSYNDIFSDFDPRGYSERALSDDFLLECKRAAHDKGDRGIELRFLIPKNVRRLKDEELIKQRLLEHFKKHVVEKHIDIKNYQRTGVLWIVLGMAIIVTNAIVSFNFNSPLIETSLKLLEVPSWFLVWEGLGKIFIRAKEKVPDYEFYKKMSSATVGFFNY